MDNKEKLERIKSIIYWEARKDYSTYENIKEMLDAIYEKSEGKKDGYDEFKSAFQLGACEAELKRLYLAIKDIEKIINE